MATHLGGRSFRLALCQLQVGRDKARNLQHAAAVIRTASGLGAHIVTLPECFQSPYATDQFAAYAEEIPDSADGISEEAHPSMAMLRDEAVRNKVYVIGGSIPERSGDSLFNTCVVFGPNGAMLARHRKVRGWVGACASGRDGGGLDLTP
jgi:omega-amidase